MKEKLIVFIFKIVTGFLYKTLRLDVKNKHILEDLVKNRKGFILSFWHGEQFVLTRYMRNAGLYILTSLSKDGDLQTDFLSGLGYRCIRGSSSRGGLKAILQLIKTVKKEEYAPVAMAVDGPRGPIFEPKEGFLYLAKKTGLPILPVRLKYHSAKKFEKAWDKYFLPYPFSKVTIQFENTITVEQDKDLQDYIIKFKDVMKNVEDKWEKL